MNIKTIYVCSKCGLSTTDPTGWLIGQRWDKPEGHLLIRCPEHQTDYARKLVGQKQAWYHENRAKSKEITR